MTLNVKNLYDGFSFDVLGKSVLQSAYSANVSAQKYRDGQPGQLGHPSTQERCLETSDRHPELVSGSAPNNRNAAGTEIGTCYRYIDETPLVPLTEAGKSNSNASTGSTAKTRSRPNSEFVLYSYGEPVAMNNDSGTSYFGTDILGSVRNVTDKYGTVQADYSYDAFGSPYLGNLENDIGFGYCGKVYDVGTGLYDYGFRDYSPVSARFTTVDPIRDGSNWFSYVVNDPVNYVDPLGLTASDSRTVRSGDTLGDMTWQYNKENGTNYTAAEVAEFNGIANPNLIYPGQTINFPGGASGATQVTATPNGNTIQAQTTSVATTGNISNSSGYSAQPVAQSAVQTQMSGNSSQSFIQNIVPALSKDSPGQAVLDKVASLADVTTSSLSASLGKQLAMSYTNAYSNIESVNCTVLNVQTSIPHPTIDTPIIKSQIAKTSKASKIINRVAWGIATADVVYIAFTKNDWTATWHRAVRNGVTMGTAYGIGTLITAASGGNVIFGWGAGIATGYLVDSWFEKKGW